ncbi:MAG: hypothetical protein JXQ90_04925 [Cyclobacteriaceae bacterium]
MPNTTRQHASTSRKLAAVLFSDIVGYTALMGKDSAKALDLVRISKDIQKPLVEKHHGKWLKEMGDGAMAQFGSALDAVQCAIEIQKQARAELDAKLRIGIHLGDITVEGDDIYGDGVNVASRIESLADPGGICISQSVRRAIKGEDISTIDLGNKELKNVDEPVQVFAVQGVGLTIPLTKSKKRINRNQSVLISALAVIMVAGIYVIGSKWTSFDTQNRSKIELSLDKSIAVMPFNNESSDEENQYFVNGMMEDIRNNLAKIADLRVISKTSTETYRNSSLTSMEIGDELSVAYLLEGTVQKIGSQVKIHAQLISANNDDHLWQETYVKDISDIREVFTIQSEIAQIIALQLQAVVKPAERDLINSLPTMSAEAYDFYLLGRDHAMEFERTTDESEYQKALLMFEKAMKIDPEFAAAMVDFGYLLMLKNRFSNEFFSEQYLDTVLYWCNKALDIDHNLANGYFQRGEYYILRGELENARKDIQRGLKNDPNNALGYLLMSQTFGPNDAGVATYQNLKQAERLNLGDNRKPILLMLGRFYRNVGLYELSEKYFKMALEIQEDIDSYSALSWTATILGKFELGHSYSKKIMELGKDHFTIYINYAMSLDYLGRYEEADEYWQIAVRKMEKQSGSMLNTLHRYAYHLWKMGSEEEARRQFDQQVDYCLQMLDNERYGGHSHYDLAAVYAFLGEKEKVLEHFHLVSEVQFAGPVLDFVDFDPLFDPIRDDKEFQDLVDKAQAGRKTARDEIEQLEKEQGKHSFDRLD